MTSKKLLSAVLALMLMMSFMTALPVSAVTTDVVATVNGQTVADGGSICAVSTVTFTLPEAVVSTEDITFWELSKYTTTLAADGVTTVESYNPWYSRLANTALSNDGLTVTATFAAGALSSNSTYKFEFDTDAATDGAEYDFTFSTTPARVGEKTYYMQENFSRYNSGGVMLSGWTTASVWCDRYDPIYHQRGWTGKTNAKSAYGGNITTWNNKTAIEFIYNNAVGFDNEYFASVPANATPHIGETVITFGLTHDAPTDENNTYMIEIAGILFKPISATQWKMYAHSACSGGLPGSDRTYVETDYTYLGTIDLTQSAHAITEHTLSFVTSTSSGSRTLRSVAVDGVTYYDRIVAGTAGIQLNVATKGYPNQGVFFRQDVNGQSITNFYQRFAIGSGVANTKLYLTSMSYSDYVAPALNVTATNNNYVEANTISWTFDQAVDSSTISGVTLTRLAKGENTVAGVMDATNFLSLDSTGKVLTATFADGDLTAGFDYAIALTTSLRSLNGGPLAADTEPITFTAKTKDHYYMNETFEQYKESWGSDGDNLTGMNPWRHIAGWTGLADGPNGETDTNSGIRIAADGDRYLCLDPTSMLSYSYNSRYSQPLPVGETGHRGILTAEVSFVGSGLINEMSGVAIQPGADGTWTIYYRKYSGEPEKRADISYRTRVTGSHGYTAIGTYASGDTALDGSEKHIVAIESEVHYQYIAGAYRAIRTIYGIKIDGNPVCADIIGNGLQCDYSGYFADGVYFNDEQTPLRNGNTAFYSTQVADVVWNEQYSIWQGASKGTGSGEFRIYAISYRDAIAVDAAQSGTALTFTVKNDTSAAKSAISVLAIYDENGLVRVDGLNATATSIAAGATETFTKTVAADEAGYTYKFMLLDSKDGLQPLWYATKGTIN